MKKVLCFVVLCLLSVGVLCAHADKKPKPIEGTSDEELKKLVLPHPSKVKIAVLPFGDFEGNMNRRRFSSASSFLLSEHEGFLLVPILDVWKATEQDKEIEPDEGVRRTDAIRIGKSLGAQWAIYGEVKNIRGYEKTGWFNTQKKTELTLRVSLVDCESGEIIYWRTQTETISAVKQIGAPRPDTITRNAILSASVEILKPLFTQLPPHETVANIADEDAKHIPDSRDVLSFVNRTWPEEKK